MADEAGCCQPAAADDTELAVNPNSLATNWVITSPLSMATAWAAACLARTSAAVDGLQDFGLPRLLLGVLLVLLLLLGHDPMGSSLF
jgi:hypothetical protein